MDLKRYSCSYNTIIKAENIEDARQQFALEIDGCQLSDFQCFEYPKDSTASCEDIVNLGLKP